MKRTLCIFLLLCLLVSVSSCAAAPVSVKIDGTAVAFSESTGTPFIDAHSRTLVPLRAVMEAYGCQVDWDPASRTASVALDENTVRIPVGQKCIHVNETSRAIDTEAVIRDGRIYLPIRAVLEALGAIVDWDGANRTVIVTHPGLQVHFLDVGQADCILLRQGTHAMLVDAGNNDDAAAITDYLNAQGISALELVVGTHPHEDHIGALDAVLRAYDIGSLWMPRVQTNTRTFEDVLDAALKKRLTITAPKPGTVFSLGEATVTVAGAMDTEELNNSSLILRVVFGETSFLLAGDAETDAETDALNRKQALNSTVLKVGHHGSETSSSDPFLDAVQPQYAVISCGKGNSYGHPHSETLRRLENRGVTLFRTDTRGTVVAISNGKTVTWSCAGDAPAAAPATEPRYILNTNTGVFHLPTCGSVKTMKSTNRADSAESREALIAKGFTPCGNCKP